MQLVLQILHKSMAPFGSYDFFFLTEEAPTTRMTWISFSWQISNHTFFDE